jgi:hypothetical protein
MIRQIGTSIGGIEVAPSRLLGSPQSPPARGIFRAEEVIWIAYFALLLFLLLTLLLRLLLFLVLLILHFPLRLVLFVSFLRLHVLDSRAADRGRIGLLIFVSVSHLTAKIG